MKPFNLSKRLAAYKIFSFLHNTGLEKRDRLIMEILNFDPSAKTFFDTSCGSGVLLKRIHEKFPRLEITAIDLDSNSVQETKKLLPEAVVIQSNIASYQIEKKFDVVFSSMTLHHVDNPEIFFKRVSELVSDAGSVVLLDVIERVKILRNIFNFIGCPAQYHFETFYTLAEIKIFAEKFGLEVKSAQLFSKFPSLFYIELKKIIKHDTI